MLLFAYPKQQLGKTYGAIEELAGTLYSGTSSGYAFFYTGMNIIFGGIKTHYYYFFHID
jgi:hypothetical protein